MPVFSGIARRADLAAVLSDDESKPDENGQLRASRVRTYVIYSGRQSQVRTSLSLFDHDPLWNEGELSSLIKRQFGPTGLKHLLGVMIAAEEQATGDQQGAFVFDASQHLDILGYSRSNRVNGKGYHSTKHLRDAREIVMLLCSLTIVQENRLGAHRGTTLKVRLLQDEASIEAWEETVADGDKLKERITTNEKIFLRFNPHLFNAAAEGSSQTQALYTHQLKKLARENARTHGLTLTLGVNLPIKFRQNECQPLILTARSFLRMAGITEEEYTKYEQLERLENTLRYMVEQGYINGFETQRYRYISEPRTVLSVRQDGGTGQEAGLHLPANRGRRNRPKHAKLELKADAMPPPEPLEEMWQVDPPSFLSALVKTSPRTLQNAQAELLALSTFCPPKNQPMLPGVEAGGLPPDAGALLKQVRLSLKLQQSELANRLGITQAAISMAEAGKRPHMAERLLEKARRIVPE